MRLKNAVTAPTPLQILPDTVTPQVTRNALAPQARHTQEPQRTELQQAGKSTEPARLSMIRDLPPLVELPTLPRLPANKQREQYGEKGNKSEKEEKVESDALTLFRTPFVSDVDVRKSRNIKRAEAMLVKLGLHMLPQQFAATTRIKPRKKSTKANAQASRKSKRVRVGAETNDEEEGREEPQLRDSPEKEEAKRDEAGVIFDNE
jgi:hypothetical protein